MKKCIHFLHINNERGISLVEVLLAVSVFILLVTVLVGAYLYGQEATLLASNRAQAVFLAEEGLEVVRNIRDNDFSNLSDGTYGLATSSGSWVLSGTSDDVGIFTRSLTVSTIDSDRKEIVSNVTWQQNAQRAGSVSLSTQLAYWMRIETDAGDWSTPTTTASFDIPDDSNGWKVTATAEYAYVVRTGGDPDFVIFDISDPESPSVEGSLDLSGGPRNVAVSGDYVYVVGTDNSQELQIIDVSSPTSPSVVGVYNAPGNGDMLGVSVVGDNVFMSGSGGSQDELYIVDASSPTSPSLEGSVELGSNANEVYVSGNYAYVASDSNAQELQVIDVSNTALPSVVATLNLTSNDNAETVDGFGATLIIGRSGNSGRVHVIDISNPLVPSESSVYIASDDVWDVSLGNNGQYIFVANDENATEFQVLSIATSTTPWLLGSVDTSGDLNGVYYSSDHDRAFVVGDDNVEEFMVISPQ